jgi:DNA-binding beta-propeller fold protein YncE
MRAEARRVCLGAAALAASLATSLVGAGHARTQRAEPGQLVTLRGDLGSPTAIDLGGPRRDGVIARTFAGERHEVVERLPLPGRRSTAPVEWLEGRIAVSTGEGVTVRMPDGHTHDVTLGPTPTRPIVLPSNDLFVITNDGRAVTIAPDLTIRAEARGIMPGGALALADGSVVIATRSRSVVRLDAALRTVFSTSLSGTVTAGVAQPAALLSPTRIVVAVGERLYVLDLAGSILSSTDVGDRIIAAPVVDRDGHVHVLVQAGQIVVVDHGRHVRARITLEGRGFDANAVLARDGDGSYRLAIPAIGVLALEPDGTTRWSVATDAPFHGPLAIDAAHTTLAFDRRGRLGVISVGGELRERIDLGGIANGFPMIASDGTLWASTDASQLVHVAVATRPDP